MSTQPTPGPWENNGQYISKASSESERMVHVADAGKAHLKANPLTVEQAEANAELIAAAGTAASELPHWYDPIAVMEHLPDLIAAAEERSYSKMTSALADMTTNNE